MFTVALPFPPKQGILFWEKDKANSVYEKCKNKDAKVKEVKKKQSYLQQFSR